MSVDRFGNAFADGLPYARGAILPTTADDIAKLKVAWGHIRQRRDQLGTDAVYLLSGLERNLQLDEVDLSIMDDEIASALFTEELTERGLDHLGGDPARHDIFVFNRLTAALLTAADVMVEDSGTVIGVSPRYSHPAVRRAVDTVFLTRLSVSYENLSEDDLREIVSTAKDLGAKTIVDDAGGARVGPACFGQPRLLELGVDVGATGLDKYGTTGPRLGLLGGEKGLVKQIRARAYEMGVEARQMLYPAVAQSLRDYSPDKVRERVAVTKEAGEALKKTLGGNRVTETPVIVQLMGDDVLEMAMERAGLERPPLRPHRGDGRSCHAVAPRIRHHHRPFRRAAAGNSGPDDQVPTAGRDGAARRGPSFGPGDRRLPGETGRPVADTRRPQDPAPRQRGRLRTGQALAAAAEAV